MAEKLPISTLLQMSCSWENLSGCEQIQIVREGMFVEETLEMVPIWELFSQEERQQIFFEAWSIYAKINSLNWIPVN
ncbi:MAG: hypothetical protein AAB906_03950 [Patescibacteria group bacterium]